MLLRTCGVLISVVLLASCATPDFGNRPYTGFGNSDRSQDRNALPGYSKTPRGRPSATFGLGIE